MKVNSEDTDPQTRQALAVLGNVEQKAATLLATSAILASFNGRSMVDWLAEKVEESEIRGTMLQLVKDGLEALPQDSWFTHSFDQRACLCNWFAATDTATIGV